MKKKMFFIPVLLVMFLFIFAAQPATAADTWATVSIDRVGQNGGVSAGHFTQVSANPIFTNQYLRFDSGSEKQLLATALTALSLGQNLVIRIKDGSIITLMWIVNN
jgi:hypothetical protein